MIIVEATKIQPYLDFIQNKESVVQEAKKHIQTAKLDLNKRPLDIAEGALNFLKSLTEEDIRWGNIQDRILVITWARRVVHKNHHLGWSNKNGVSCVSRLMTLLLYLNLWSKEGSLSFGRKRDICFPKKSIMRVYSSVDNITGNSKTWPSSRFQEKPWSKNWAVNSNYYLISRFCAQGEKHLPIWRT